WGLPLAEEALAWRRLLQDRAAQRVRPRRELAPNADLPGPVPVSPDADDPAVTAYLVRSKGAGGERIDGWLRVDILAGQRHASAHVAICPPFLRVPRCFAEAVDGPAAEVKIRQALPYGVRFDVKLERTAAQGGRVLLEFAAEEQPADDAP